MTADPSPAEPPNRSRGVRGLSFDLVVDKRVRVVVSGDVQGVGFRWYTREEAMGRGVAGSVRNLPDGKVEAVFEGDAKAVDAMVEWCRSGPTWARVDSVEVHEEPHRGEPGFRIDH